MGRFFDVRHEAVGVIAIGQGATGVVAVGQAATGLIAIGQLARGGVAVGQLSLGVIAVGQLSLGVLYGAGMLGVGAKAGWGIVWSPWAPMPHLVERGDAAAWLQVVARAFVLVAMAAVVLLAALLPILRALTATGAPFGPAPLR